MTTYDQFLSGCQRHESFGGWLEHGRRERRPQGDDRQVQALCTQRRGLRRRGRVVVVLAEPEMAGQRDLRFPADDQLAFASMDCVRADQDSEGCEGLPDVVAVADDDGVAPEFAGQVLALGLVGEHGRAARGENHSPGPDRELGE